MQAPENAYAVILAGGGGTRLWPKSRKKTPKHLLKLFGGKTLLRMAYERVKDIISSNRIFIVTIKDHENLIKTELPEIPKDNIICEPVGKNTALAMGVGSALIHKKNPNAAIIYLAADHLFRDTPRFQESAIAALKVALSGDYIVAIGIKPDFAHTGLGYLKMGNKLESLSEIGGEVAVFKVAAFKEKPDLQNAQTFVSSGGYLWNANLYTWSTTTILKALEKYSPKIYQAIEKIINSQEDIDNLLGKIYESLGDTNSIDYEVSEKADNMVVIPSDFGWSDIGDWKAVYEALEKDLEGNVTVGKKDNYLGVKTKNSLVKTNDRMIVTVGVEDLIIVDTEDAILICSKDKSQDVKQVVEKLKQERKDNLL